MKTIKISGKLYKPPIFIAGPCVVQKEENNIIENAREVKKAGAVMLRGGAFKPRSDPKSFQGLGEEGLKLLVQARDETNLPIVTEIMDASQIELFKKYDIDVWQIGARNMANSHLLKAIGRALPNDKAVLLKRGFAATKKELLFAIEYLTSNAGREQVMVCERGIRTFASGEYDRFTFDIDIIADLANDKNFPHLIIADPSHAAGRSELIENISLAAIAAGADGLIIETMLDNADRNKILCDANQATKISDLKKILEKAKRMWEIR